MAASFEFGARNEWTARLPSALSVLAVALAFVTVARASLGPRGSTLAALIWLTNFGMIEKGRLIEIEALYVSLCGLAIIFWLSVCRPEKSPWLIWLPASIFLGLGLLAKGPIYLVFFYGIVVAVIGVRKIVASLFTSALRRARMDARNCGGMGHSVFSHHELRGCHGQMGSSHTLGMIERHRF